ncbi:MAG: hypothetical protein GEU73_00595 [Chloroflexi bacterium]|nr:hypothetical protein [Chloroflexota bacterium]
MHTDLSRQTGHVSAGRSVSAAPIAFGRLLRAAALTAAAVAGADIVVYVVAAALWGVPSGFSALNPGSIIMTSVGGVVVAAVGLAALARLTRLAVPLFVAVAAVVTLLSLTGPFQAMAGAMPGLPPATTPTGITMIVLHVFTGGLIAVLLPAQARQ